MTHFSPKQVNWTIAWDLNGLSHWYITESSLSGALCCFLETPNTRFFLQSSVHFQSNIAPALSILLNHQAEYSECSWNLLSSLSFLQNEAGKRLTEFFQENALVIVKTLCQQHKRQFYTWTSINGQYWNQNWLAKECNVAKRSCIQSAKTRPGANCSSDHQLVIEKFRLKLKKTRKNNRPPRYDLTQILKEFTVGITNRFKELDLVNSVPEELWTEVGNIVQVGNIV